MTLNYKLAFEIWVGIVILVVVIGGAAGVTLLLGNETTSTLVRTQADTPPTPTVTPFVSNTEIHDAANGITQTLLGGSGSP